jgi:cell division inhibitor SepF
MQAANPVKRFFSWLNAEDVDEEMEPTELQAPAAASDAPARRPQGQPNRGPLLLRGTGEGGMEIRHPRSLEDRNAVGLDLKQRRMVTLDLTKLPDVEARYFLEFIYGVVFALDATIEKVTDGIYLLAPRGVNVRNDSEGSEPPAPTDAAPPTRGTRTGGRGGQEELFWQAQ